MSHINRLPFDIDQPIRACEYRVGAWSDQPLAANEPPSAVMFELRPRDAQESMGIRFQSAAAVDELIAMLRTARTQVWPQHREQL